MSTFINLAELLIAITLIVIVLLQAKGTSASVLGGGGGSTSSYRTRRGVEKTLFTATIVLGVVFLLLALFHPLLVQI